MELREKKLSNDLGNFVNERDRMLVEKSMFSDALLRQKRLNNELLSLGGELRHVVLMVDVSNSMKSGIVASTGDSYWRQTQAMINRWIYNLDVGAVALIFFGDKAELVLEMQNLDPPHRTKIVEILERTDPNAKTTNFLAAFETAYKLKEIDTIIVFSDGLPSVDINGKEIMGPGRRLSSESEREYAQRRDLAIQSNVKSVLEVHREINTLANRHPTVAINAVGLGDKVYTPQVGNLLNQLTLSNGGVFIAIPSKNEKEPKRP